MKKIITIFGTRPEAIKMAPVVKELQKYPEQFQCLVLVTAQHREMLDQVLNLFQIKPDYDLNIMKPGQSLFDITSRVLQGLGEILSLEKPDLVLVHGDTSTTFTAALAAYYLQIPVAHVEAGLRTFDKYSPFPEEINRHLTGVLADLHFAPTAQARENLLREGIDPEQIFVTGNTVIDALLDTVAKDCTLPFELTRERVLLVTTHRRENLGEPMRQIYRALAEVIRSYQNVQIVFPVHRNPLVRQVVEEELGSLEQVTLIEPLDYHPFVHLMQKSYLVLTDSGGMQEEAPSLGKPVLVLRNTTERPEAVMAGTVRLTGTDYNRILSEVSRLLDDPEYYAQMSEAVNPYGDGQAARRIVQYLLNYYDYQKSFPEEFKPS